MPEMLAADPSSEISTSSDASINSEAVDTQETTVETPVEAEGSTRGNESTPGRLSEDVKSHIEELKSTNPDLANRIASAIRRESLFQKEFPGGLKEARAMRQMAEELGGQDGVAAIRSQISEIEELDRLWEAKDPRAIQNMVEDYPEQFSALMPNALEAWVKTDPEGFNKTACSIISNTFQAPSIEGHSFSNLLWMLGQTLALGNIDESKAIVGAIKNWSDGFAKAAVAERKVEPRGNDRVAELEGQLANEKTSAFNAAVGAKVEALTEQKIMAAVSPYLKGRTLTQGQRETLNAKIVENIANRLSSDRQFNQSRIKYSEAGDQDGLVKFSAAKIDSLLPGIVKESYRWLFGGSKLKPKASSTGTQAGTVPVKGWVKVSNRPGPHDIDRSKSPIEMLMKNSAIMKDGRRVYWGDQPYKG